MIKFMAVVVLVVCGALLYNAPELYTPSHDYRTKQLHPATIIDIDTKSSCGIGGCFDNCKINLQLSDLSIRTHVIVQDNICSDYIVGSTIELERHITDPAVITRTHFRDVVWLIICACLTILGIAIWDEI